MNIRLNTNANGFEDKLDDQIRKNCRKSNQLMDKYIKLSDHIECLKVKLHKLKEQQNRLNNLNDELIQCYNSSNAIAEFNKLRLKKLKEIRDKK